MTKSISKYLLCVSCLCSYEVSATTYFSSPLLKELLLQEIDSFFKDFPGNDETKASVFTNFLIENREELKNRIGTEMKKQEELKKQIQERNEEIIQIWGSPEKWDEVCGVIEDRTYEIANRNCGDETNTGFFSTICSNWTELLKEATEEQIAIIKGLGGFQYGLAIMLINAQKLFDGNLEPLKKLCGVAKYEKGFFDFSDTGAMSRKGEEIMQANRNYDLAYEYLGEVEYKNEKI